MSLQRTIPGIGDRTSVVPWLYWLLLPMHRLLLSFFFGSIVIHGSKYLPTQGPAVLAPKHYSRWALWC